MSNDQTRRRVRLQRLMPWVVGTAILLLGIGFYIKHLFDQGARVMIVQTVDENGQLIDSPKTVLTPAPETVPHAGITQLGSYVDRLLISPTRFTSLLIAPTDERFALGLSLLDGQALLGLIVNLEAAPQDEAAIRAFFAARDIVPTQDYLASNGGVPDNTRILTYPVPTAPSQATPLIRKVLLEVYHLREDEGMKFSLLQNR